MNWEKVLSYVLSSGFIVFFITSVFKFFQKKFRIRNILKAIYWELKKNRKILDEIKDRCDRKINEKFYLFDSLSLVHRITSGIVTSGLLIELKLDYIKYLSEIEIVYRNVEYSQDEFIRITKETDDINERKGVNLETLCPTEITFFLVERIKKSCTIIERDFYDENRIFQKLERKFGKSNKAKIFIKKFSQNGSH